jgi:phospholipid N-methyltransferase
LSYAFSIRVKPSPAHLDQSIHTGSPTSTFMSSLPLTEKLVTNPTPSQAPKGPDWWLMLTKFLKQGRSIASFAPSSRFMARSILKGIDFDRAKCIVELGAGTGPITAELVKRIKPHTKLLTIELDPDMAARLKARFPMVDVVNGDACQFDKLLAERGFPNVDHVISGLPLPSFPDELRNGIMSAAARTLAPGGSFRQLTVMPWVYYKLYRRYFDNVQFNFVLRNLPPGGVYVCDGYRNQPQP